ncbi:hypothetical protein PENTCL1PPCAC_7911, partial [Pristionchus entomophagus]
QPLCLFRMVSASVTPAFVLLHFSLTSHLAVSTFECSFRLRKNLARLVIVIIVGYYTVFGFASFNHESLTGNTQLCPFYNSNGETFIIVNMNLMLAFDFVNCISALFLLRHNRRGLAKERNAFKLNRTFRRVQTLKAMEQLIPIYALHSISHLVHF